MQHRESELQTANWELKRHLKENELRRLTDAERLRALFGELEQLVKLQNQKLQQHKEDLPAESELGKPSAIAGNGAEVECDEDGRKVTRFKNGAWKEAFPTGHSVSHFPNNDYKHVRQFSLYRALPNSLDLSIVGVSERKDRLFLRQRRHRAHKLPRRAGSV